MAVEAQPTPQIEQPHTREQMDTFPHRAGLRPRLLLSDEAINPDKRDLQPVTKEALGLFEQRDYSVFERASDRERSDHWEGREDNNLKRQKRAWIASTTRTFAQAKNFFADNEIGQRWSELYARLDIDTENFESIHAETLYDRYFTGERKSESVKHFVSNVVSAYQTPQGIDYERLQQDLPAVEWLGNIFGETSSEVIRELVDAEVQLQTQPDTLVAKANEEQTMPDNSKILRINNLNDDEVRLLRFLWAGGGEKARTPPPQPAGQDTYRWRYERLGDPRKYPEERVREIFNPRAIAQGLKQDSPQRYGNVPTDVLAQQIETEQQNLYSALNWHGLTEKRIQSVALEMINSYKRFITSTYGITVPAIETLQIFPITGKTAEYYRAHGNTFAFAHPGDPVIFLNIGAIAQAARELGIQTRGEWQEMTPQELGDNIERLLKEVHPHEYTHLIGDTAYWHRVSTTPSGQEESEPIMPAKTGTQVLSPRERPSVSPTGELTFGGHREIGRGLMEAITVELTNQWARHMGGRLDLNAYPQERNVLHAIENLIADEQNISQEQAFTQFAKAYFDRKEYHKLVELINKGREHPRFTQFIYALMEYETEKSNRYRLPESGYPLTLSLIAHANNLAVLPDTQKQEIAQLLATTPRAESNAYLTPSTRRHFLEKIGFQIVHQQAA